MRIWYFSFAHKIFFVRSKMKIHTHRIYKEQLETLIPRLIISLKFSEFAQEKITYHKKTYQSKRLIR